MTKIVIVGGGSYAWGPLFIRDILVTPALAGSKITLHDINSEAMGLVFALGQKIVQAGDYEIALEQTDDLDSALDGAGFVILTITTGGLEAMRHDLEIPARYGIVQSVGDTVGPGGLARGLRNIPVVVEIGRRMESICPDAWLLNYTNPMTTLTRAVSLKTDIQIIGLCHEYVGVQRKLAQVFGVEPEDIHTTIGGINHLPWMLDFEIRGQDAMAQLVELAAKILATRGNVLGYKGEDAWSTIDRGMVKSRLLQIYGGLPAAGDRHVAEFFPHFLTEATQYGKRYGIELTNIEERYRWRARDEDRIHALLNEDLKSTPFMKNASHEAANKIVSALVSDDTYAGIMNLPNQGQISNLAEGAIVETMGIVDASGAQGNQIGDLPNAIQSVVARHLSNQELIVEAALAGERRLALQALLNDPMVRLVPDLAGEMLDEMLFANRKTLPRFFRDVET